jgi:Fervidolysin N-terminal prodomain
MVVWLTVLLQIACLAGPAQEPPSGRKARFVPGELIVKFKAGSEAARLAADPGAVTHARTTLGPYTDRLSREIGLPVEAKRTLSGGEVLLSIGLPSLTNRLLGEACREDGLKDVRVQEGSAKTAGQTPAAVRAHISGTGLDTQALTKRLTERLGFQVQSRSVDGVLLLFVDSEAVTLRALEAVKGRPDVEYAQLNYVLGKLGA